MNKDIYVPIILQVLGVVVIIAEIILPSGGILSLLATVLFGYSLYLVFIHVSSATGMVFIIADLVIVPILVYFGLKFLAKSPVTLRKKLSRENGVVSQPSNQIQYIGCQGQAISDLRPSGVVVVNGERLDVVTRGEYVGKQTEVVVIAVRGNQIIVKERESLPTNKKRLNKE